MNDRITESVVEEATLAWLEELKYSVFYGPDIAPGEPNAGRACSGDALLPKLLSGEIRAKDAERL